MIVHVDVIHLLQSQVTAAATKLPVIAVCASALTTPMNVAFVFTSVGILGAVGW